MNIETPYVAVDCIIQTPKGIVLIKRGNEPFKGSYALPGGFIDIGESAENACIREMKEETNLILNLADLRLVGVYSDPKRDSRRQVISIAYHAHSDGMNIMAGDDATDVYIIDDVSSIDLAFDHDQIIKDALSKIS